MKRFEVTCLFPDTGAPGCFESSPSASRRASGSGFASGWSGAPGHFELSSSASKRVFGSGFASGWTHLRFNIGGPAKLSVGTSMPKLAQLAGFNN